MKDFITLSHGSGGKEMMDLIHGYRLKNRGNWKHFDDDSSILEIGGRKLAFTSDSFIVDPLFFPGGDIGSISVSGAINDLCVMGAMPLGLSLSFVIEEGFPKKDLNRIIDSINKVSEESRVAIVTGDTKVMEKGKIDKFVINVSGVGILDDVLRKPIKKGDKIILSGGLGEHAVALLSKRFDFETDIVTDSKPLNQEIEAVKKIIRSAKDITRGGLAANLNEIAEKNDIGMLLDEEKIPAKEEVRKVTEMLGLDILELACEGRFVCISKPEHAQAVVNILKKFNEDASIIGEITDGDQVIIQTVLGKRMLPYPTGRIVPRIC